MLAVVYSKALIFPANKDGADDIADYKYSKEDVVELVVVSVVEATQED